MKRRAQRLVEKTLRSKHNRNEINTKITTLSQPVPGNPPRHKLGDKSLGTKQHLQLSLIRIPRISGYFWAIHTVVYVYILWYMYTYCGICIQSDLRYMKKTDLRYLCHIPLYFHHVMKSLVIPLMPCSCINVYFKLLFI